MPFCGALDLSDRRGCSDQAHTDGIVIALCLSEPHAIRTALLASFDLGMTTNEFLYIIVNSQSGVLGSHGKLTPIWKDVSSTPDGRDDDALQAYLRTMSASLDSYQLYHIVILYAKSLNRTISEDISQLRNGTLIIKNSAMTIQGISGPVTINDLAQLVATLTVSIADRKGEPQKILSVRINHDKVNITTFVSDPEEVWSNYGGVKPLDVPQCGLQDEKCTSIFGKDPHVFASLLVVSLLVIVLFAAIGTHIWREKVMHEKEINMKWLVPFTALQKMVNKKTDVSTMSMQSEQTRRTVDSLMSSIDASEKFYFFTYENESIVAEKHAATSSIEENRYIHLRKVSSHVTFLVFVSRAIQKFRVRLN
ncbi:hypothetical protein RB195_015365 [Necator americanus]|uniref:Receptor ligand binding region domain-containing protein n=1 Tax=Necator americanus TaxID=51031 RepID=A0ABR1E6V4_NECAM